MEQSRSSQEPMGGKMLKYLLAWFPMALIAIANGIGREAWYKPSLSNLLAHQLNGLVATPKQSMACDAESDGE